MFNKKGEEHLSYFTIIEIVLLLMVAGTFSVFVYSLHQNTQFERTYLSKDLSLLTHAVYASPGDVEYKYYPKTLNEVVMGVKTELVRLPSGGAMDQPEYQEVEKIVTEEHEKKMDISLFDFEFNQYKVRVADTGLGQNKNFISYFTYHNKLFVTTLVEKPESLVFVLKEGEFSVEKRENG